MFKHAGFLVSRASALFLSLAGLSFPFSAFAQAGTTPGTASFVGNFTTIAAPSGALALGRQPNCSLGLATGSYSITGSGLTYTQTDITPHYELLLHNEAQLSTTPDVFASGCAKQAPVGIGSRPGVFVGTTTTGLQVFAGLGLTYPSFVEGIYVLTGTTSFSISSFAFATAGNLAAADLNKDGNGDLVILDNSLATSARVTVMLGNANGSFQTAVEYPIAGNYSVAAVIDDVNGDGKLDIVAVSGDQQISVLLGNGDGTFQAATSFAAPALPGYTSNTSTPIVNLITADLRGIGRKDIVCSNGLVLLGSGTGTFAAAGSAAFPYTTDDYSLGPGLASGDINNDGKPDLVVNNGSSISTWIGRGDGTFNQGSAYAGIGSVGFSLVNDLDGDGNADIFVGLGDGSFYGGDEGFPRLAYALMGNGDGTFRGAPQALGGFNGAYDGTNLGDVNGDGVPDLIIAGSGGAFLVQLGTGKGTFTPSSIFTGPANFTLNGYTFLGGVAIVASSYAVADVNGDGKADLVWVSNGLTATNGGGSPITYPSPVLFVALSNGDGSFQTPVPYAFPQIAPSTGYDSSLTVTNLQLADVNKDNKTDLIFSYNEAGNAPSGFMPYNQGIGVLLGNGDGTFSTTPVLTSSYSGTTAPNPNFYPYVTNIADMNNDGKPDLVGIDAQFISAPLYPVVVYLGNGDGSFQTPKTLALSANVYATPVVEDFNKDGKMDVGVLAETSASQAELVTALGNGDGTFGTPTILNLTGGDAIRSGALASADFDLDGNIDIALLDNSAFSGVFYGNGMGGFSSVPGTNYVVPKDLINLAATNGGAAVAVDLNKDGKPDILAGSTSLLSLYGSAPTVPTNTTTVVTSSNGTITAGSSVTLTATVTPASGTTAATGTVTFYNGATKLGTGTLNGSGVATYQTSALPAGSDSITAVYGGDTNFNGSTSPGFTETVNAAVAVGTSTTLMASSTNAVSGTSITLTATVTPASGTAAPTGAVTFMDGTNTLGMGTLNGSGVATYTTSSLAVGAHSITAGYGGVSGVFSVSTSSVVTVTITTSVTPSFALSLSAMSTTVTHGNAATTNVSVASSGGFTATVALTCMGAPANSSCSIAPSTLTPTSASPVTATVTLATSVTTGSLRMERHGIELAGLPLGVLAGLMLLALPRYRRWATGLLTVAVAVWVLGATGCGGKGSSNGSGSGTGTQTLYPAAGTYTLTITGTSGSTTKSTPWTVIIQ